MFGVVVLLRDKNPLLPSDQRRVVLKQPIRDEDGHDELLKEIKALKVIHSHFPLYIYIDVTMWKVLIAIPSSGYVVVITSPNSLHLAKMLPLLTHRHHPDSGS